MASKDVAGFWLTNLPCKSVHRKPNHCTTDQKTPKRHNISVESFPLNTMKRSSALQSSLQKKQCENLVYFDLFWIYTACTYLIIAIAHIPKKRICILYILHILLIMLYICKYKYIYIYILYTETYLAKGPWNESLNFDFFPILNFGGCYWLSEYIYIYYIININNI